MSSDLDQQLLRTKLKLFWSTPCRHDSGFTQWLVSATSRGKDCHLKGFDALKSSLLDFISLFRWVGFLERDNNQYNNPSSPTTNGDLIHMLVPLLRKRLDFASALQCSAALDNESLVKLFIKAGDQLNIQNCEGETALTLAIRHDSPAIARLLLKNGATVRAEEFRDLTTVILAVKHGSSELAHLLLEEGLVAKNALCDNGLNPPRIVLIYQELQMLCRHPVNTGLQAGLYKAPTKEVLSSASIESISRCLRDLGYEHSHERPRIYAILHMLRRTDLMDHFVSEDLLDDSLSYMDARSLPNAIRSNSDVCRQFLEQMHAVGLAQIPALVSDVPLYRDDPYACVVPGSFPESPRSFEMAKPTALPDTLEIQVTQSGDRPDQGDERFSATNGPPEVSRSSDIIQDVTGSMAQDPSGSTYDEGPVNSQQAPGDDLELHSWFDEADDSTQLTLEAIGKYREGVHDEAADTDKHAATSVMHDLKSMRDLAGLMLPIQDNSMRYLEQYSKQGKYGAVRTLLKAGCNPGTEKQPRPTPIFNVVKGASPRHTKCLRSLIAHGVNVNVRASRTGKTPLMVAVDQPSWPGYATVVYLLLSAGANPDARDIKGDAPLLQLLHGEPYPLDDIRRRALALLLSSSYNTNLDLRVSGSLDTLLHLAIFRNDPWAVGMILDRNVSLETKNAAGLTPLQFATNFWSPRMRSNQLSILDLLLEKDARVNMSMDGTDMTPLHIAVSYGLLQVAEKLLCSGAEPRLRTKDGRTVHDLADERKQQHGCQDCRDCSAMREVLLNSYGYIDVILAEYACFWDAA